MFKSSDTRTVRDCQKKAKGSEMNTSKKKPKGSRTHQSVQMNLRCEQAQKADYMLRFREDPRQGFLDGLPGEDTYENRDGWGRTTPNAPATGVTVYGVNPGNQETAQVIASGVRAIAYTAATFTVQSGMYVYSATLAPGIELEVTNITDDTAAEAGKLKVGSTNPVAIVERFDTSTLDLTVRQLRR